MNFKGIGALIIVVSMLLAGVVVMMPSVEAAPPAKPRAPDTTNVGPADSGFGWSVAADGGWIVVGAPFGISSAIGQCGLVRVFTPDGNNYTIYSPLAIINEYGRFGESVAVHGDSTSALVVVGAPHEYSAGIEHAGRVYLIRFTLDGTVAPYEEVLNDPGRQVDGYFGMSVATNGNEVIVGAPGDDGSDSSGNTLAAAGKAFVWTHTGTGWGDAIALNSQNPQGTGASWDGGGFGDSVTIISPGCYAVGAPYENVTVGEVTYQAAGRVYYFEISGISTSIITHISPNPSLGGEFGHSVAGTVIGTDKRLVVGAPFESSGTGRKAISGLAYILNPTISGGTPIATMTMVAKKLQDGTEFGRSVATDGTNVLVGAPEWDASRSVRGCGQAYKFSMTGTYGETFVAPNEASLGHFGYSVALDNGKAVVGAPGLDKVYVYNAPA